MSTIKGLKVSNVKSLAMKLAGTFTGVALGGTIKKALNQSTAVEGLAGEAKDYLVPVIIAAGGMVMSASVQDDFLKNAGFGVSAVGGASLVNQAFGKEVITLNGVRGLGRMPRRIPAQGVARTTYGVGRTSYENGMSGMGNLSGCIG